MGFKAYVTFDTAEFTPDQGEKGRRTTMVSETVYAPTKAKLRDEVQAYVPASLDSKSVWDASGEDGVTGSCLVTNDNMEADATEIKAWEAGKLRLWIADIFVRVSETTERELSPAEAASALGIK